MFVPTQANLKLDNGSTGHAQVIGIVLRCFISCPIIYPAGPVYYCPGHTLNTVTIKFHQVPSNFMLFSIILHLKLLNIVIL